MNGRTDGWGPGDGSTGRCTEGVVLGDMGEKTTGNDLDNACIRFEDKWWGGVQKSKK